VDSIDNIRTVAALSIEDTFYTKYENATKKSFRYVDAYMHADTCTYIISMFHVLHYEVKLE